MGLYNPFRTDPALPGSGAAQLDRAYQLVVSKPNQTLLPERDNDNVLGEPDGTQPGQVYDPSQVYRVLSDFAPAAVNPSDQPGAGDYVLAPPTPVPGVGPGIPAITPTMRSDRLTYRAPAIPGRPAGPPLPTLLLRRLAGPSLPWQPDPGLDAQLSPYNPYVTVDQAANVPRNVGASNTGAGVQPGGAVPAPQRRSAGRREPYDGRDVAFSRPRLPTALASQPQHAFYALNEPREAAFQWLVHLDRPPVSPVELLHVSACQPHQLTQMFQKSTPSPYQPFGHSLAGVWDDASPLHRLFEFLATNSRSVGAAPGVRIPGKVNIHSVWDPEVFRALCDPQPSNSFTDDDGAQLDEWMLKSRSSAAGHDASVYSAAR